MVIGPRRLDGRQQILSGDGLRDFEFVGFESERACHAAATGLDRFDRGAGLAQKRDLVSRAAKDSLVMAVPVDQNLRSCKAAGDQSGAFGSQPVGKQPDLLAHLARPRIVGKQLQQLVFEDAGATRLEKDEGQSGVDLRRHPLEHVGEISPRRAEKAEVVQRAAAADVPFGV